MCCTPRRRHASCLPVLYHRYTAEDAETAIQLDYALPPRGDILERATTQFQEKLFQRFPTVSMVLRVCEGVGGVHSIQRGVECIENNPSELTSSVPSFTTMLRTPAAAPSLRLWDFFFAFPFTLRKLIGSPLDRHLGVGANITFRRTDNGVRELYGRMSDLVEFLKVRLHNTLQLMQGNRCTRLLPPPVGEVQTPHRVSGRRLANGILATSVLTRRVSDAMVPAVLKHVFIGNVIDIAAPIYRHQT